MLLLFAAVFVYLPGLKGVFLLDSIGELRFLQDPGVTTPEQALEYVATGSSGFLGRPLARLFFLLDGLASPLDVTWSRSINLALHCFIAFVIFLLAKKLFQFKGVASLKSQWLAVAVMGLWVLHPLNVSTTLYVVQRMAQLSTLSIIIGLFAYLSARDYIYVRPRMSAIFMALSIGVAVGFGALAKENAVMLFWLIALVESVWISTDAVLPKWFVIWRWFIVYLPSIALVGYIASRMPEFESVYKIRDFNLSERLYTEARILCLYLSNILIPNINTMTLFGDGVIISKGLLSPITTLFAVAFWACSMLLTFLLRRRFAGLWFAFAWFVLMHVLESTVVPLELYFEHRNYLPMIGVFIGLVYQFSTLELNKPRILGAAISILIMLFSVTTFLRSERWGIPLVAFTRWEAESPQSVRAAVVLGRYWEALKQYDRALNLYSRKKQDMPEQAIFPLLEYVLLCQSGEVANKKHVETLQQTLKGKVYSSGIPAALGQLVDKKLNSSCPMDNSALRAIISLLEELILANNVFKANASNLQAAIYVEDRNFSGAMTMYDKSFGFIPAAEVRISQATLLYSAGRIEMMETFLAEAEKLENNKRRANKGNLLEIRKLREVMKIARAAP